MRRAVARGGGAGGAWRAHAATRTLRSGTAAWPQQRAVAVMATRPARARRGGYDDEALREAAAALALEPALTEEERRAVERETSRAASAPAPRAPSSAGARQVEAPEVGAGEEVGHFKWQGGEEFVLREVQPGQLAYLRVLRPGVTPLMAFGERRGNKRKHFAYKGHVSPYFRISPKSPLRKFIVSEKDLIEEGRRARLEWERDMWPKSKKRPKSGGEAV